MFGRYRIPTDSQRVLCVCATTYSAVNKDIQDDGLKNWNVLSVYPVCKTLFSEPSTEQVMEMTVLYMQTLPETFFQRIELACFLVATVKTCSSQCLSYTSVS